nr:xylulose kinase-1 [Tanacetum cinerariifolium]
MFKNFNREDLEVLRSIVKERFKKTKPVDDMENLLFQTLKTLFEHQAIWEVNGDAPASIALVSGGAEAAIPPKTTEQKIARRNELKVKSTLLLAIPDEHLLKFHGIKDAKTLWEAIKTR